jgi:hypothetical protein
MAPSRAPRLALSRGAAARYPADMVSSYITALTGPPLDASFFDFEIGTWNVKMRRRRLGADLQPAGDWVAFDATVVMRTILGGLGNVEDVTMYTPDGVKRAAGSRFYNPDTKEWRIYWSSEGDGRWQEPMVGGFAVENGMLIVTDEFVQGAPVKTCYVWRDVHTERPYWEQNFSNDGGATWTCNWTMEFSRA